MECLELHLNVVLLDHTNTFVLVQMQVVFSCQQIRGEKLDRKIPAYILVGILIFSALQ
jgi:hypothetical protein